MDEPSLKRWAFSFSSTRIATDAVVKVSLDCELHPIERTNVAMLTGSPLNLTTTWVQIANLGQSVRLSVLGGTVFVSFKSTTPSVSDIGHQYLAPDRDDFVTTENVWARADVTAKLVVSVG